MIPPQPIEIRVSGPNPDKEMNIYTPWDSNIEDWKTIFKTILTYQEFPFSLIEELFGEEAPLPENKVYLTADED